MVMLAFVLREAWRFLPDSEELIRPFPFSNQEIYPQTYVWIGFIYVMFLIFARVLFLYANRAKEFMNAVFVIQACELAEYFANYNQPWGTLIGLNVNLTTIRFPFLLYYSIRTFSKWNSLQSRS